MPSVLHRARRKWRVGQSHEQRYSHKVQSLVLHSVLARTREYENTEMIRCPVCREDVTEWAAYRYKPSSPEASDEDSV